MLLTIVMTMIVVFMYTAVAFNFFRHHYAAECEEADGCSEPGRSRCHTMLQVAWRAAASACRARRAALGN